MPAGKKVTRLTYYAAVMLDPLQHALLVLFAGEDTLQRQRDLPPSALEGGYFR
jgi:hypothetical protein